MEILNNTLNTLQPGDLFIVPNQTFHLLGGIHSVGLKNVTIQIDGTLSFDNNRETWPTDESGHVLECMLFEEIEDVVFTSAGKGTLDGNGQKWWGAIQFLKNQVPFDSTLQLVRHHSILFYFYFFKIYV